MILVPKQNHKFQNLLLYIPIMSSLCPHKYDIHKHREFKINKGTMHEFKLMDKRSLYKMRCWKTRFMRSVSMELKWTLLYLEILIIVTSASGMVVSRSYQADKNKRNMLVHWHTHSGCFWKWHHEWLECLETQWTETFDMSLSTLI